MIGVPIWDVQIVVSEGVGDTGLLMLLPLKLLAGVGSSSLVVVTVNMGVRLLDVLRHLCSEADEGSGLVETFGKVRFTCGDAGRIVEKAESKVDDTFFSPLRSRGRAI